MQAAISEWQQLSGDGGSTYQTLAYACADPQQLELCAVPCDAADTADSCTCERVSELVGNIGAVRTGAFQTATDFKDTSDANVGRLEAVADYSTERVNYDVEYMGTKLDNAKLAVQEEISKVAVPRVNIINVSVEGLIPKADVLMACVSMRSDKNYSSCMPGMESARQQFEDFEQQMERQLEGALERFDEYTLAFSTFQTNVETAFDNMANFYDGFRSWFDTLESIGVPTDAWFNMDMSDFVAGVPATPNLPATWELPGATAAYEGVQRAYDEFVANITLASEETRRIAREMAEEMQESVENMPDFSLDDYNPPEWSYSYAPDAGNISQQHRDEGEAFLGKMAVSLDAYAELSQYSEPDYEFPTYNFSIADEGYSFYENLYFRFERFASPQVNFKFLMLNLGDVNVLFILFDYVWRSYRSFYLFRTFWKRSGLAMPDADMRVDRDENKMLQMNQCQLFLTLLTNVYVSALIGVSFLTILCIYLAQGYLPLYCEYYEGCVAKEGNGTFVTQNLFSISYNYAAEDGNQDYFNGLEDYNLVRTDYCAEYSTSTQEQQQEDLLYLTSLKNAHASTKQDVWLMAQCVDAAAMDEKFERACCGLQGYEACSYYGYDGNSSLVCPLNPVTHTPFLPLSHYLNEPACEVDSAAWALEDAVFHCDNLPECVLTCNGPEREVMKVLTEQCSCTIEWLMHSSWLKFALAFTIYALMNVSRVVFTGALSKLMWRYLSPGVFTYKATCDYDGAYIKPGFVKQKDHYQAIVRAELHKSVSRWESFAWIELVMAILVNVPWFLFLNFASADITYDPNLRGGDAPGVCNPYS